jgi:hypothetical protein
MFSCVQAVLLVGFSREEFSKFSSIMQEMEADMVALHCADSKCMENTLKQALEEGTPGFKDPPEGGQHAVFLSGMYTPEVCLAWKRKEKQYRTALS